MHHGEVGGIYYFELRAWVPLIAYVAYILVGKRLGRGAILIALGCFFLAFIALVVGLVCDVQLSEVVGANLRYESAVENMVFGFVVVGVLWRRTGDVAFSLVSSILCLSAAGWMYEVSFWHSTWMFITPISLASPLAVNTQIISLVLFIWTLWRRGWRPGELSEVTFIIYLVSGIYVSLSYPNYAPFLGAVRDWFIRFPTYAILLSVIWEASQRLKGSVEAG